MDIYRRFEKATTNVPLNTKNRGVVVSNISGSNANYQLFTYGATGATYSTTMVATSTSTYFFPIRTWGVSFDNLTFSVFGAF
jgi:hypothetical protein